MSTENLDYLFNPRSVAVAGVSSRSDLSAGNVFVDSFLKFGFRGPVYPVNTAGGEIFGLKIYKDLREIPDQVDLVVSSVSAPMLPDLIRSCEVKGVKALHVFTSGFGESGTEEGVRREEELCRLAKKAGLRILGPNCMGVYCPSAKFSFGGEYCKEPGNVGLICQSGGNTIHLIRDSVNRGVRFSKAASYGNGPDINETDLLEYMSNDPETEIIISYIEGVRDGKRFFRVLKDVARTKPVVVFKGGYTDAGVKTAASHTGSMAGSNEIWDGLLKQAGAIRVNSLDELVDMAVSFRFLNCPKGRKLGIIGFGGGAAVNAADECFLEGLTLPELSPEIQKRIKSNFFSDAGTFVTNPVDLSAQIFWNALPGTLETLLEFEEIDALLVYMPVGIAWITKSDGERSGLYSLLVDSLIEAKQKSDKPIGIIFNSIISKEEKLATMEKQQKYYQGGIPVYFSMRGAARAIKQMVWYRDYKNSRRN